MARSRHGQKVFLNFRALWCGIDLIITLTGFINGFKFLAKAIDPTLRLRVHTYEQLRFTFTSGQRDVYKQLYVRKDRLQFIRFLRYKKSLLNKVFSCDAVSNAASRSRE